MKNKSFCMQISFILLAGGFVTAPMAGCGLLPDETLYVVEGESMGEITGDLDRMQDTGEGEQSPGMQSEDTDLTVETTKEPLGDNIDQTIPTVPQEYTPAPSDSNIPAEIPIFHPGTDATAMPDIVATPVPEPVPSVQSSLPPGVFPTPTPGGKSDPMPTSAPVSVTEPSATPTPVPEAIVKPTPAAGEDGGVSVDEDGTVYLPEIPFS